MTKVLLIFLLAAQFAHGPYAGVAGAKCWRPETDDSIKRYHCTCKLLCKDGRAVEDDTCITACGSNQCLCHTDEAVCPIEVQPSR